MMADTKDDADVLTAILTELRGLRTEVHALRKDSARMDKNIGDLRTQMNASNAAMRAELESVKAAVSSVQEVTTEYTKSRTRIVEYGSSSDSRGSKRRRAQSRVIVLESESDSDRSMVNADEDEENGGGDVGGDGNSDGGGDGDSDDFQSSESVKEEEMKQKAYMTSDEVISANKPDDPLSAFPIKVSNRINLKNNGETAYAVEFRTADDAVVNGVFSNRSNAEAHANEWIQDESDEEAEYEIIEVTVSTN